jgi:hypothetical protein
MKLLSYHRRVYPIVNDRKIDVYINKFIIHIPIYSEFIFQDIETALKNFYNE